jgi:hypothetical protein
MTYVLGTSRFYTVFWGILFSTCSQFVLELFSDHSVWPSDDTPIISVGRTGYREPSPFDFSGTPEKWGLSLTRHGLRLPQRFQSFEQGRITSIVGRWIDPHRQVEAHAGGTDPCE